jgi:iron(III) transport system ATP-binding protein
VSAESPTGPRWAVEVRGLGVAYGLVAALAEVSLQVRPGEVVALLGPSGSGKSTLLHAIAGFVAPHTGEIWLNDRRIASAHDGLPPEQRDLAMVFQNYALWPHLTALDTVAYPARRRGASRAQARTEALEILDRLNLAHLAGRHPAHLSGGEQQRVGLARALARRASLYLFDEPTAHLDTHVRGVFLAELRVRQRGSGAAALYATHDAEEALGLADRVALLAAGRVGPVGRPEQVYGRPVDEWAARLTGPASVLSGAGGRVLVRPEWAVLGGDRPGVVSDVWFRGPHTDYLLDTGEGPLLVRHPGPPEHRRGDPTTWTLRRSWPLRESGDGNRDQVPSWVAGPE